MADSDPKPSSADRSSANRSLANIAGIVAVATLISKLAGLFRQQAIGAAFAVGPVADAYSFAYIIPGFLLILLGGINGPFHSAIVSVVAKQDRKDTAALLEAINTLVGLVLVGISIVLFLTAGGIIDTIAPGLGQTEPIARDIAVLQLRIMSPMALFAGLIGIGFGALNADSQFWLPSISPIFSSGAVLLGLGLLYGAIGANITNADYFLLGGAVLAGSTLAGAVLQWLAQLPALWKSGLGRPRLRFDWKLPGVQDVFKVLIPATLSSGMLQINLFTDLFFASFIPGTAAALSYANLLVQTPLGIISNVILVPFLPLFARLATPEHWPELKDRIRQSLLFTALTMLPLGALFVVLASPIVRVIYERGAFDADASAMVTSLLIVYGLGMFIYLARDVLVRVFYAMGDGQTPFRISLINIVLNGVLDFFFIRWMGAPGLVLATVGVNLFSTLALTAVLHRRLRGLPLLEWTGLIGLLAGLSALSGTAAWGTLQGLERGLGTSGIGPLLLQLLVPGGVGVLVFILGASVLPIPEVRQLGQRLSQRFRRR
ncbi:lipid II flippase MurJ [Leptolyngbya sp. BL0902]|uniref:murein biosynthesis integral membrane protein MurJ n=1 Tax=Leptolyngbya sp. BL0902 TaxID=1115757 RepID=UPI001935C163|nr:murein biosynthesis integral membrane protein MurJ [Leptolyngbya sp. BL0902]QQE67043.1 lipid II flippase MurJ [Leptolyngbya sp. BL0902]